MIRVWVEVVAYNQGVATVQALQRPSCGTVCSNRGNQPCCGRDWLSKTFNKRVSSDGFCVSTALPLQVGQQLELGILTADLLHSVLLLYLYPLVGLLLGGGIVQCLAVNEFWVIAGALLGAGGGCLLSRSASNRRWARIQCQPTILQVLAFPACSNTTRLV